MNYMSLRTLAAILAVVLAGIGFQGAAESGPLLAVYFVDTTLDPQPAGGCATDGPGDCSLREAVILANNDGMDTEIDLPDLGPAGLDTFILQLADPGGADEDLANSGDLDILAAVTIFGSGHNLTVIDANSLGRAFEISTGGPVLIQGVKVTSGRVVNEDGGGILNYGGLVTVKDSVVSGNTMANGDNVFNSGGGLATFGGMLTLTDSVVSGNVAQECPTLPCSTTGPAFGGGIFSGDGALVLLRTTIRGNSASDGGGIHVRMMGDDVVPMTRLTNSRVTNNTAGFGAGIYQLHGFLGLTTTTVDNNKSDSFFPGSGVDAGGTVQILRSTIRDHEGSGLVVGGFTTIKDTTISGNGTGLQDTTNDAQTRLERVTVSGNRNYGLSVGATTTILNSTISGNGSSQTGAGIHNDAGGDLFVQSSTITGNRAQPGFAAGIRNAAASVRLLNTIVANNIGGEDCANNFGGGTIDSLGYNIDSDDSCFLDRASDKPGVNPLLGPLADNGGFTRTRALLNGSPAIDTGQLSCPPPATDQRKLSRPRNGTPEGNARCDRGAFERNGPGPDPT
ncbi:MAG: right-handed parallel beta-helix repeat-containing protein [Dehalococcoidia bacterium]